MGPCETLAGNHADKGGGERTVADTDYALVQNGDTIETFCERHNIAAADLISLNERELVAQAQARGFNPTYQYQASDAHGKLETYTGWHIFAGESLRIVAPEKHA